MPSLQKIPAKRQKSAGRGAPAKYLWRKQFKLDDDVTLRLGRLSEKTAVEASAHIDHLIESKRHGTAIAAATKGWLQSADPKLIAKLHKLGLCHLMENPTVVDFATDFLHRKRATTKEGTVYLCEQVKNQLASFFSNGERVSDITKADAKRHWTWLIETKRLAPNTAKRRLGRVREIFNDAIEHGIISNNPFALRSLPVSVGVGKKEYVPTEVIQAVIDHLPADKIEWKLLFAFGRFVGCRMPSEIADLTWDDVNVEANTICLKSPKTAHHEGKAQRFVPIFPEVAGLLSEQYNAAPSGAVYVFPTLRNHSNTATTAKKLVTAAGFATWPKFWNSLRASRETDLMDSHGIRKACQWIGNSMAVAEKHYALMKKSDYLDAGIASPKSAEKSAELQGGIGENGEVQALKNPGKTRVCAIQATRHGLEP